MGTTEVVQGPRKRFADGKRQITVVMTDDMIDDLEVLAGRWATDRSAVITRACVELLARESRQP